MKAIVVALALAASAAAQAGSPRVAAMPELSVPPGRLPTGCALSPAHRDVNTVRGGLWAGLPIPDNPWTGPDRRIIALLRARMDGPGRVPDGPPLSGRELASFRMHLADGVEEGYAAVYKQAAPDLIVVYALRFAPGERPLPRQGSAAARNPNVLRVSIGSIVAVVSGDGGACYQAVGAHVKSLATGGA